MTISNTLKKRLRHEVTQSLLHQDKRGCSKHKDKTAARALAQKNNVDYRTISGLYASGSFTTYEKAAMTAVTWIAERYHCKNIAQARSYLPKYYEFMVEQKLSAWTIHTRVYALCSVFGASYQELFHVENLPARRRRDIKRTRTQSPTSQRFHSPAQLDAQLLARACGARRGGLQHLYTSDLHYKNGALHVHLREKGGKERDAIVLPQYAQDVQELFERYGEGKGSLVQGERRMLSKKALPKDMALHHLRASYAKELYAFYLPTHSTGQLYHCRGDHAGTSYDKGALMAASKMLGHSRCDVVVSHYLI